ncbi:imidazole glycerol phosphate synthase subunit HisF [Bizionia sediminis]|uniref:Imidazole glycerol phosphate synthase subunit HisF n=1 Tax=Bizionia sediminis TaxID=1737064 RepID=A0ABW5KRL2_9FLAO
MLTKRIIPCLDIKNGRTVKGVNFVDLKDAGDPIVLAKKYAQLGADELVFLDISATLEGRSTWLQTVLEIAKEINIPFTVGGGVRSVADVNMLLQSGADKVAINSAAIKNPELISLLAKKFGKQCIVIAIDAKPINGIWKVHLAGGTKATDLDLFDWAKTVENLGAGEILFTSMAHDGTKKGFANKALAALSETVNIPIIASGGAGSVADFITVFKSGKADAALAASVFHFNTIQINQLKQMLHQHEIPVRL